MRLATRALTVALASLVLCAAVSAQTPRMENDPRNQSPSVGTGGPEGGPTGLFTIYDGSTLRRGEFTFSIAYSNFDRDPGNVDIVDTPLSFNLGLNDHIEIFFKALGYRGIKVNNPQNLSSFYLPNSQLFFGATLLCTGPAIILPPERVSGSTQLTGFSPLFRPAGPPCNVGGQRFVQYPFVGGVGPNFGLTGSAIQPPFVSRLGAPSGGTSNFGAAANFPGVGSVVGSILPGIVFSTRVVPPTATTLAITVPALFTIAPSYLPDAPFINRLYGESTWGNMVVGAKIRLTGPHNPFGVGIIPFYRWYLDKGADFAGFNQMQRGAGPGGEIGDFGLIGFADGRLSEHVNLSANFGYILNSNPKDPGGFTLLDRPDEIIAGIGFDFPVNKHFQPIVELRSTHYVAGRTPNAAPNNPVDLIAGAKVYPARWWGLGGAYRLHVNPQGERLFGSDSNLPAGFAPSDDPHGFIGQFWIGHRNARGLPPSPNVGPTVSVSPSSSTINLPCPEGASAASCTPSASREVTLTAAASDPDNDTLLYTWSVTGGRISGDGREVTWDLSGVNPGTYTATVEVNDGNQHTANASTTVTVAVCECAPPPCPSVSVSCPSDVDQGSPITFNASVSGGPSNLSPTYNWSVSAGTITSGQGTSSITVDTAGLGGQTVTATVDVGGVEPACGRTASCSTQVKSPVEITPTKFDEYGDIKFNDEKARLDNYAIQLQNQTGSQGYIIAYGTCEGQGQARADRAKNYLVNTRGIEAGRIVTIDGGCRSDLTVQLWIVPTGATPPAASSEGAISPCPECKKRRAPRRRARGRRGDDE
ncbi:MAG: PKD domain-containing protein [Pyrinomonadaceae bacterium]